MALNSEKTRLIEFGRHAVDRRARRGLGKPETFKFLGFTHICGQSRRGKFLLKRRTRRDRMRAKLTEIKEELRRRMHQPIPEQGQWLAQVVRGFFAYITPCRPTSRHCAPSITRHGLMAAHATAPQPEGSHDVAADREDRIRLSPAANNPSSVAADALCRHTPKVGAACGNSARAVLCGGRSVTTVPTANRPGQAAGPATSAMPR